MRIHTGMLCSVGCGEPGAGYYVRDDVINILCFNCIQKLENLALEQHNNEALESIRVWAHPEFEDYFEEG